MPANRRRHRRLLLTLALLSAFAVLATFVAVMVRNHAVRPPPSPGPPATLAPPFRLSDLAPPPDWSALAVYQETITREEFSRLLTDVFTAGDGWRAFIEIGTRAAAIETVPGTRFLLRFAATGESRPVPRDWRPAALLDPPPAAKPLAGLRIAIDPGHLGGLWARMEERWFALDDAPPVTEGDLTLTVAKLLKPQLEALGATVSLVRSASEPVTPLRPDTIEAALQAADPAATATLPSPPAPGESPHLFAERLFYRTAEIRARAAIVNTRLKPDLVLCLHFNAEAWGDPAKPTLVPNNHFHVVLSGALTDEEVALPDQRFEMLRKLLQHTHAEELAVATTVAAAFAKASGLPPYRYEPNSTRARNLADNPFLWARNLLANRLYACPVVFLEPYVMNSPEVYARLQAGNYPGTREIRGQPRPSIFREYADAVAKGLAEHYQAARPTPPPRPTDR